MLVGTDYGGVCGMRVRGFNVHELKLFVGSLRSALCIELWHVSWHRLWRHLREELWHVGWHRGDHVSITIEAVVVGSTVGGFMSDKYGHRSSALLADAVFAICVIVMVVAPDPTVLIIGQILISLGVGVAFASVPLYIS
jgi:MFS family permease